EHGPQGFTLNEASRSAGVSASAPYRHFRDRNALIEATAEEGFKLFRQRLEAAVAGGSDPYDALARMGAAYYGFAMDEPGLYQAMFSSGLPKVGAPVAEAGARAFAVLEDCVKQLGAGEAQSRELALKIWAFSHGMAGLIASGAVSARPGDHHRPGLAILAHRRQRQHHHFQFLSGMRLNRALGSEWIAGHGGRCGRCFRGSPFPAAASFGL